MSAELEELRRIACEAALAAGAAGFARYRDHSLDWERKEGPRDLVSLADRAAEGAAVEHIRNERPDDIVWGEEGGYEGLQPVAPGELRWAVDGVDGTSNFLAEIPHWCASVGVEDEVGSLVGAVYHPASGELFSAARGRGMTLDGVVPERRRMAQELSECVCAVGISYSWHEGRGRVECLDRLVPAVAHVRQMGSMALDIGYIAAGRYDLYYYEAGMHPHDIAQRVIASEAGLEVKLLEESDVGPRALFIAPPHLIKAALEALGR